MVCHRLKPTHYHTTLAAHEPVLHVADGDSIRTTTVDAGGRDQTGKPVTPGGNPQTGPFYIESAEPGDTLAVHLDHLAPNRSWGYSASVVAPNVVDPWFARKLPEGERVNWIVDAAAGTATLDAESHLGRLVVPLDPMLGCFGVAPAGGQAISTATSGPHGGNMDYRGFRQGVTAYFPVAVPGALLHLGDGHAVQGDGEIVGTGIEISFDLQVTVRVLKGRRSHWPGGEDERSIFTVGNARPLDQCIQHATTEMLHWLETEYGLDTRSASILLGQCVRYEMGNVFDPAYTMVCKLAKRWLHPRAASQ